MKIGEVAQRAGIAASALRYYEQIGLMPAPQRISGQRRYDESALKTLKVIKVAQAVGFSLQEIRQLLHGFADDTPRAARWKQFAGQKLAEIDAIIQRYQTMKRWLQQSAACGCIDIEACELVTEYSGAHISPTKIRSTA